MGGDELNDLDEPRSAADLGSVGDWALPGWAHRIPGIAWLFIGLAIADLVVEVYFRLLDAGEPISIEPGFVLGLVARALTVALPAAVLWTTGRPRPSLSEPLLGGAVAIALSILLSTVASAIQVGQEVGPDSDPTEMAPLVVALRLAAALFAFGGPTLLALAILRRRTVRAPRWAVGTGLAIAGVTIVALAFSLDSTVNVLVTDSEFGGPGGFKLLTALAFLASFSLVGRAFLAWAVISAAGDPSRPRPAWTLALVAVIAPFALVVLNLASAGLVFLNPSPATTGLSSTMKSLAEALAGAYFSAAALTAFVASALLVAAFALGLGRPTFGEGHDEEDDDEAGLDLAPDPSR